VGKIAYRYGLNFNQRIKSNLYFKTGFRYAKVGYQSEVKELRFGNDIQIAIASGDVVVEDIPTHEFQEEYSYTFIEIPLMVRYELKNHRFTPFFEIGMWPNFYVKSEVE
jgi:hypothetical protein